MTKLEPNPKLTILGSNTIFKETPTEVPTKRTQTLHNKIPQHGPWALHEHPPIY